MASSDDVHVIKAQGDVAAPSKAAALSRQVHWVAGQKQRAESVSEFRVLSKDVQWTSQNGSSGP